MDSLCILEPPLIPNSVLLPAAFPSFIWIVLYGYCRTDSDCPVSRTLMYTF